MNPVGIRELKANLSAYVERARSGEEIIVMHRGVPVVKVIALDHEDPYVRGIREGWLTPAKNPGGLRGLVEGDRRRWEFVEDPVDGLVRDREAEQQQRDAVLDEPWSSRRLDVTEEKG
jgi:prevent-host-death family protein